MKVKEKEKRKLKKNAKVAKPQKHAKKSPANEKDEKTDKLELEHDDAEVEEPEHLDVEEEDDGESSDGAEPSAKNGKAPGRPKGRPGKRSIIVDDDLEEDGLPDADEVGEELIVIPRKPRSKRADENGETGKPVDDPTKPLTRLGLIRSRHEAIRREIDQIREDLEAEEEE